MAPRRMASMRCEGIFDGRLAVVGVHLELALGVRRALDGAADHHAFVEHHGWRTRLAEVGVLADASRRRCGARLRALRPRWPRPSRRSRTWPPARPAARRRPAAPTGSRPAAPGPFRGRWWPWCGASACRAGRGLRARSFRARPRCCAFSSGVSLPCSSMECRTVSRALFQFAEVVAASPRWRGSAPRPGCRSPPCGSGR